MIPSAGHGDCGVLPVEERHFARCAGLPPLVQDDSQLPVRVAAKGPHLPAARRAERVVHAHGRGHDGLRGTAVSAKLYAGGHEQDRCAALLFGLGAGRDLAALATAVLAPAIQLPGGGDGTGVPRSGAHGGDGFSRQVGDRLQRPPRGRLATSAALAVSTAVDAAIGAEDEAVLVAGRDADGRDGAHADHGLGPHSAADLRGRRAAAVAQLPQLVGAPAHDFSGRREHNRVVQAAGDGHGPLRVQRLDHDRARHDAESVLHDLFSKGAIRQHLPLFVAAARVHLSRGSDASRVVQRARGGHDAFAAHWRLHLRPMVLRIRPEQRAEVAPTPAEHKARVPIRVASRRPIHAGLRGPRGRIWAVQVHFLAAQVAGAHSLQHAGPRATKALRIHVHGVLHELLDVRVAPVQPNHGAASTQSGVRLHVVAVDLAPVHCVVARERLSPTQAIS
mmetsp:Transcript_9598/g.35930  ORF Transcript_9598/g.35930 Transcript_9598/m.35930 type:complete len:448 (-) Transcript_9598:143-1486(-)